jgi:hypothetical protein
MYWFSILVNVETGELLCRILPDGLDPTESIEPLDNWYNRYYGDNWNEPTPTAIDPTPILNPSADITNMTVQQINDEISRIRGLWNTDRSAMSDGLYATISISPGISAFSYNGQVKMIEITKNTGGIEYSRTYQFENGNLVFAYIEGSDSHRLYFIQGTMFRWRYTPNVTKSEQFTDYDKRTDLNEYINLQEFALEEANNLYSQAK